MKYLPIALVSISPWLVGAAHAEGYISAQLGQMEYESDEGPIEAAPNTWAGDVNIGGIGVGYKPQPYWGIELRAGGGLGADDFSPDGGVPHPEARIKVDYYYGLFARAEARLWRLKVYALGGLAQVEGNYFYDESTLNDYTDQTGVTLLETEGEYSGSAFSYALGIGLVVKDDVSFNLEYFQLAADEQDSIAGLALGMEAPW